MRSTARSSWSRVKKSRSTHSRRIDFRARIYYNRGMEEQEQLASVIGKNLTRLRRMANLTQLELAEKLNYSDKSVSKWEQGNGIPDVRILVQLADLYGVSLDDLVREQKPQKVVPQKTRKLQRYISASLSVGLCWLVAVVAFVLAGIFAPNFHEAWLAFLYAVPASAIVVLVLSSVWHYKTVRIIALTLLIWSILACIYLTCILLMPWEVNVKYNTWLIFLVGVPLQILALFFFVWRKKAHFKG